MAQICLSNFILCLMSLLTMASDFTQNSKVLRTRYRDRREVNLNYTEILNFWDQHKTKLIFQDNQKDVVLMLGNTGSGKSTLISALTGQKLKSSRQKDQAYRIFVDEEGRIGTDSSSKTLIPEAITDSKRNVTYVDCSGYRDNRNIDYEISSIYFQNILMHRVKKIKIILVINYDSLKNNGNKNDFDDLLEHFSNFIRNISKFSDGIALVATKVENIYDWSDDEDVQPVLLNDDRSVLKGIANYLRNKQQIYRNKIKNSEKYKALVDLIDILIQKKNDSYLRIAIFRQPTRTGELEKLPKTKNEINTIANMIAENLNFVEKNEDDFGFALSKSSKMLVDQIVDDIFQNTLINRLDKMGSETHTHYLQMEKKHSDIGILRNQVSQAYEVISGIKDVNEPLELFKKFIDAAQILNISVSQINLNDISDDVKKLQFFTTVSNSNKDVHMILLKNELQKVIKVIENLKNIYNFLNNLQRNLATYESQRLKNDNRIQKIKLSCAGLKPKAVQNITELGNIIKEINSDDIYQIIKTLQLNKFQLKHTKAIFDAFTRELTFSCTSDQLIAKGYNVKMSDVVKIDCWIQAKNIHIFALNKIFMDCAINKEGEEAQMFVLAPTWEIVGKVNIILDGRAGKPYQKAYAKSSDFPWEEADGFQGLPGGPAGHFFGVGQQFINSNDLMIYANGGKGGPGQHGGNGVDGVAGETLPRSFFETRRSPQQCKKYFNVHSWQYLILPSFHDTYWNPNEPAVVVFGKEAKIKPGRGGDGGAGGYGGYPGTIVINGLGKLVNASTFNNSGLIGLEGQGGHGGKKTFNGLTVSFSLQSILPAFGIWSYSKINYANDEKSRKNNEVPAGRDGKRGLSTKNVILPTKLYMTNPHFAINAFKEYIIENLLENIKESELRSLIQDLENDNYIEEKYSTLVFVREFEGFENQYRKFGSMIDFVPFYNSLLNRIEKFSISEKLLENKKVLGFIYTAALTKMLVLKKRRKGKTIVNLPKYLDTIETSISEIHETLYLQTIQNYRNEYLYTLTKKMRAANDFINKIIAPEIDKLWEKSNDRIKAIFEAIDENKNSTIDAITKFEKEKIRIHDTMQWHAILGSLEIATLYIGFVGKVGTTAIATITSMVSVAKGMLIAKVSNEEKDRITPIEQSSELTFRVTRIFENKSKQLAKKMLQIIKQLQEYNNELSITKKNQTKNFQKIDDLDEKLHQIINTVPQTIKEAINMQEETVKVKEELTEFRNIQEEILKKEKKQMDDNKIEQKNVEQVEKESKHKQFLHLIKNAKFILNSAQIVFNLRKQLESDKNQINNIDELINKHGQQLSNLEKMENEIYKKVIPDLIQIEQMLNEIKTLGNGSSHAQLDVTKWSIRTTLKDVKSLLQKITHKMSFELRSNLECFMEKIDEGFSILIDIYNRIDAYSDNVKQAEYIAHIESATINNIQMTDAELSKAMIDLKLMIHSNILIEKYETALHAFKQHYFPFASHVLRRFQLPTALRLNDTETLRINIINRIRDMKNHIDKNEAMIGEYSKFIHRNNVFNSNRTGSLPFYRWKYETVKNVIQQLLNGSEIIVNADISKGLFYNSIKYNDIGINFKLHNRTLQNSFTSVLENFTLLMTMMGNNYYRCGERYYYISLDDDITISYTLSQDETKNWINPNMVYTTIRGSHTFLSPYGMWSIKLDRIDKSVSWDQLHVFANEKIDLELIGRGYYIEQNPEFNFEFCDEDLDSFYDVNNIVKELE